LKSKPVGTPMKFEKDRFVTIIEDQVKELNEFFAKQKLRGGSHHGYITPLLKINWPVLP
jgi:hypothetical protein